MNTRTLTEDEAKDSQIGKLRLDWSVARLLKENYPQLRFRKVVREHPLLEATTLRKLAATPLGLDAFITEFASIPSCGSSQLQLMREMLTRELRYMSSTEAGAPKGSGQTSTAEAERVKPASTQPGFIESKPVTCPVGTFCVQIIPQGGLRFVTVSRAFLEIAQLPDMPDTDLFKQFLDLVNADDRASLEDMLETAARDFGEVSWEGRLLTNTGLKTVSMALQPPNQSDAQQVWHGALQDLTELRGLQSRFETVLDAAQAYTWRRDLSLKLSQFGARWAKFAYNDLGRDSLPNDEWLALVHPDDASRVSAQVQLLEQGKERHQTLVYRRKLVDGSWVWLRVHAGISEEAEDGTPLALAGVSFDITAEMERRNRSDFERSELQSELDHVRVELERTAYDVTENIPVGTYTMVLKPGDEIARFGFISRRFLEITGLSETEARGDPMRAFACVHPDDYEDWVEKNIHAFIHRIPFREETRLLVNRRVRWVIAESVPRLKKDGSWIWEGVIQDITSQKLSERALRDTNKKLLEATRVKTRLEEREQLLQEIHDGFGSQLAIGKLRLRSGAQSAEDAIEIIDDCLDDLKLLFASLDAQERCVWGVLNTLKERLTARAQRLPVALVWDIELAQKLQREPTAMLQLGRIVQEAVANSMRHAQAQSISITVRKDKSHWLIEVKDDGTGFDVEQTPAGRGLNNMRIRAERQGWTINIASSSAGTCMSLDIGVG